MSQPLNSFMCESPDSFISSHSDNYVTTQKHPPKLSEIRKVSPPYRKNNLNSRVESVRNMCSTDHEYPSDPSDPLLSLPPPGEGQHKSPHAIQFQNCAKEILEEIETLISSTGQDNSISRDEVVEGTEGGIELLPPTASETVYSILGYAYQQQVSAAAYALQCLADCKVEVAISKSISLLSFELHREQEQAHLRSIMESLDQTFPSDSGERSIPTHISSGMVDLRVKALLKNFRKRVDKVLANNSILDWMKNSQQLEESPSQLSKQVSQRMSIISWMMAASTSSSSSSSSSSEDEESQPVSVQRIRSTPPVGQQGNLGQSQDLDIFQGYPSISDVTFKFFRSKSQEKERILMRSEPYLFKRDSDTSIPCSTSTDLHSTSLEWSKSLGSRGPLRRERVLMMSEPPLNSSLETPPTEAGVEMRPVRGRMRTNSRQFAYDPIVDDESAESFHRHQEDITEGRDHTTRIINESKRVKSEEGKPLFLRSLLKPARSFEESNRSLGKSVEFAEIPRKTLSDIDMGASVDPEEMNFLEEAHKSITGPAKRPLPSWDVGDGIPELLSGSVTGAFPDNREQMEGTENEVKCENFEQEWRAFQVTFEGDVYSSLHRLRQCSINLNRKMEHMQEYSRGMTECVHRLTTSPPDETASDREAFYSDLSFFNSLLAEVVGTSHTVGALTQENKDNSVFKLCLKYVEKLKGSSIRSGIISTIPSPLSAGKQDTLGSVSSEPVLLTEESVQACIERYISQPAQVMKWPAFRFEFSKFAADQDQVNSELSLLAKQYEKLIEQCGRDIQWLRFSMKLLIVIMFLLLLLILSAESFEKSIYNILVNLRLM